MLVVEPPIRLEFDDGFADESGDPDSDMPVMHMTVDIAEGDGRARMSITTTFPSATAMEQIDGILAGLAATG